MSVFIADDDPLQFLKQVCSGGGWLRLPARQQINQNLLRTPRNNIFPVSLPIITHTPDFAL